MAAYTGFLLLACFAGCILAQEGKLFDACSKSDIKCLSKATQDFLEKSSNGLPEYQIKALDPLIIPELNVVVDEGSGLAFEFKNIHIAGLKHLQISDFKMDTDKKSVVLKTKAVLNIGGDLRIKFTKKNKEFLGAYTASLTSFGSSEYEYSLVTRDNEEYFEVGPETTSCEIIDEPVVNINEVLQNALDNDSDARAMKPDYEANKVSLRKKTLCKIVEAAYVTVIHNIRAAGRALPKRAFFNDI